MFCAFGIYWSFLIILNESFKMWNMSICTWPSTFRGIDFIAACYLHFAPNENLEYLLHFRKSDNVYSRVDKHPKHAFIYQFWCCFSVDLAEVWFKLRSCHIVCSIVWEVWWTLPRWSSLNRSYITLQHFCYFLFEVIFLIWYTWSCQNANTHMFMLEYSYICQYMTNNSLFNVKNLILPSSIIHVMGSLNMHRLFW